MLTSFAFRMFACFMTLSILGMLLGNIILIHLGIIPIAIVIFGLLIENPKVQVKRKESRKLAWVNDTITVSIEVLIKGGIGFVTIGDQIPPQFLLVEGNNFKVIWKGLRDKDETFSYKVKCTKRGVYRLDKLEWESRHFLGLWQTIYGRGEEALLLTVRLRPLDIKRIRSITTISPIPLPVGAMTKTGPMTTDFKEIREYVYGDSFRYINWKATAKQAHSGFMLPLVNEYEREGKKVVWIFLDASSSMEIGSTTMNPFECALEAVNNLAHYYLERGCKVGLCIYNSGGRFVYPDTGRRQSYRLMKEILTLKVLDKNEPLRVSVKNIAGYLHDNPLFFVFTTINLRNAQALIQGVRELSKFSRRTIRGHLPIILVNVKGYEFAIKLPAEMFAANILELRIYSIIRELRKMNVWVLDWNPSRENFTNALLKHVRVR